MNEKELDLELIQKANETESWTKLEVADRFFKEAIKGSGFTFENCIAEIVDNSISANATEIDIITDKQKNGLYTITIKDNGDGIPIDKLKEIFKLGYGESTDYKSNSISCYGVGLKYAIINLSESGKTEVITHEFDKKGIIYLDTTNIPITSNVSIKDNLIYNSGVSIKIPNIRVSSQKITGLLKFLGVSYFPHVDNGNDLNIYIKHNNEEKSVFFTDPLYRNLNNGSKTHKGVSVNNDEIYINDLKIKMSARFFHNDFNDDDFSQYDKRQGSASFSGSNSGVYFRLNGRYITLGDNKFYVGGSTRSGQTRIRIEVDIDRDLMQTIGVNFNKSRIEIPNNEFTQPFLNKLEELVSWGVKVYIHEKDSIEQELNIPTEMMEEREDINRDLNSKRKKLSNDSIENAPKIKEEELKKDLDDNQDKKTKNRPDIGSYNKSDKKSLNIEYRPLGGRQKAFDFYNKNGTLLLIYNINHEFYNKYIKMSKESKKLFDTNTLALCDSINITKNFVPIESDVYDNMVQELLESYSKRLSNYNND